MDQIKATSIFEDYSDIAMEKGNEGFHPSEMSISITDSRFDKELVFTDADHYMEVATKSGVPFSTATPVHKHSEASEMAEQQKAERRQSAIDRYRETQTEKAWDEQEKVDETLTEDKGDSHSN